MPKQKIILDTTQDAIDFSHIVSKLPDSVHVYVTDNNGLKVNAKSLIGMLYSLEFEELWCESDADIYTQISKFIDL